MSRQQLAGRDWKQSNPTRSFVGGREAMKRFKLWAGLLTLFLSGIVIGAVGTWVVWEHETLGVLSGRGPNLEKIVLRKLDRDLKLSNTQKKRIETILCQTHTELQELRKRYRPEREQIIEQGAASMRAELSAEQQKRFDVLREKMKKRRARREAIFNGGTDAPARPCD
jgi:hypothetical protein